MSSLGVFPLPGSVLITGWPLRPHSSQEHLHLYPTWRPEGLWVSVSIKGIVADAAVIHIYLVGTKADPDLQRVRASASTLVGHGPQDSALGPHSNKDLSKKDNGVCGIIISE